MDHTETVKEPPGYEPPKSAEELLRRYVAGERYFRGADIPDGGCFRGAALAGAMLEEAWIFDADFRNADLRGASFERSNVKCADFSGADLRGASFRQASVEATTFVGAALTGTTFEGAGHYGHTIRDGEGFPSDAGSPPSESQDATP